jgi:hypothetical protein
METLAPQSGKSPVQTTITLDASQIKQFMTCQRSWYWKYFRSIESIDKPPASYLGFGTMIHSLLDHYYVGKSLGLSSTEAHGQTMVYARETFKGKSFDGKPITAEVYKKLVTKFTMYHVQYSANDFQPVIGPSGKPFIELGFSHLLYESASFRFIIEGRIDLIADYAGAYTIVDHKTQAFHYLLHERDPQPLTYCLVTGAKHAVFNYIGTQENYKPEYNHRQPFKYSQMTLEWWGEKLLRNFEKVAAALQSGDFETNETQCIGKYHPCQYQRLCKVHANWETVVKGYYRPKPEWKPWTLEELGDNPLGDSRLIQIGPAKEEEES